MKLLLRTIPNIMLIFLLTLYSASCSQTQENTSPDTLEPEPLYKTLDNTSEAINDGVLSLTIEEDEIACHHIGDSISITLTFKNLSNQSLVLQSRFTVSDKRFDADADILVWLNRQDQTPLLSQGDTIRDEKWMVTPVPFKYQTLDSFSEFKTKLEYQFPDQVIVGNTQGEESIFTPGSGQYLIRVIYQNYLPSKIDEWSGLIASNRIAVCIRK